MHAGPHASTNVTDHCTCQDVNNTIEHRYRATSIVDYFELECQSRYCV